MVRMQLSRCTLLLENVRIGLPIGGVAAARCELEAAAVQDRQRAAVVLDVMGALQLGGGARDADSANAQSTSPSGNFTHSSSGSQRFHSVSGSAASRWLDLGSRPSGIGFSGEPGSRKLAHVLKLGQ
jgi:hypothetical protein